MAEVVSTVLDNGWTVGGRIGMVRGGCVRAYVSLLVLSDACWLFVLRACESECAALCLHERCGGCGGIDGRACWLILVVSVDEWWCRG